MVDQARLLTSLTTFAQVLPSVYDIHDVLPDLTASVVSVLGISGSGVTLAKDGSLQMAVASASPFHELERVEVSSQSGPCHDAFTTDRVVSVDDLAAMLRRWPEYASAALQAEVHAVAGIPMRVGPHVIGALNLYDHHVRVWSGEELAAARELADVATSYLVNTSKVHQLEQLTHQLQHALDARVIVEQAKGVLAHHRAIGVDEAFELIRRHARHRQTTVHAVAGAIVNVGLRL